MHQGFLEGQLLIAMPNIGDPRFDHTVIFLCAHSSDGAMGLIINKLAENVDFSELMRQLDGGSEPPEKDIPIFAGGPVETARGFVLHSSDYLQESSLKIGQEYGLTATLDILHAIAEDRGPAHSLLALGYAGWGPGQLEGEIQSNGWLNVEADPELIFHGDLSDKWTRAIKKLGFDPSFLAMDAGRA